MIVIKVIDIYTNHNTSNITITITKQMMMMMMMMMKLMRDFIPLLSVV